MKTIVSLMFLCSLAFMACESEPSKSSANSNNDSPESMLTKQTVPKGKELFQAKCGACHHPIHDMTGPSLKGTLSRVPSKEWFYQWVKNPVILLEQKDAYALAIYEKWNKVAMTSNPDLSNEQIDEMMNYVESVDIPNSTP